MHLCVLTLYLVAHVLRRPCLFVIENKHDFCVCGLPRMKQYNKVIMLLCLLARCLRHLLAGQLATTRVQPEEHWLPAVTVPGPIMMMVMIMWRRRIGVRIKIIGQEPC